MKIASCSQRGQAVYSNVSTHFIPKITTQKVYAKSLMGFETLNFPKEIGIWTSFPKKISEKIPEEIFSENSWNSAGISIAMHVWFYKTVLKENFWMNPWKIFLKDPGRCFEGIHAMKRMCRNQWRKSLEKILEESLKEVFWFWRNSD